MILMYLCYKRLRQHIEDFTNYITHVNMGDEGRGTAILIKEGLNTGTLKRLPSGRGMALYVHNICIITVYAPSGAEKRRERERTSLRWKCLH